MKKIILVDLSTLNGHHEIYFRKITSILENHGYVVYATSVDNTRLRRIFRESEFQDSYVVDWAVNLSDKILIKCFKILDKLLLLFLPNFPARLTSLTNLIIVRRLWTQIGKDATVFLVHADSILPLVPLALTRRFMPFRWVGLQIQPSYQANVALGRSASRRLFYAEQAFSLPSCKAILVLHPSYQRFYRFRFKKTPFIFLPELTETPLAKNSTIAETVAKLAAGRKIVSIIGSLMPKRNLLLFLKAVSRLNPKSFFAVVIGLLDFKQYSIEEFNEIKNLAKQLSKSAYICLDIYIPSEDEFNLLLQTSDLIFLNYKSHPYSSNILIKSVVLRKPVIVGKGYLMEKILKQYNWQAVSGDDPDTLAQIILKTLQNFQVDEAAYAEFITQYSEERFSQAVISACQCAEQTKHTELLMTSLIDA